jgi:hypothetical protein
MDEFAGIILQNDVISSLEMWYPLLKLTLIILIALISQRL